MSLVIAAAGAAGAVLTQIYLISSDGRSEPAAAWLTPPCAAACLVGLIGWAFT